jgi:multiple sugar transport system permease protein
MTMTTFDQASAPTRVAPATEGTRRPNVRRAGGYLVRILLVPLAGPAIATVAILTFLPAWNSYLWPLMVVQTEHLRPVMVGISYFQQLQVLWGQIMAYSALITIPVLVMFLALQRQFIRSIASAGVKG